MKKIKNIIDKYTISLVWFFFLLTYNPISINKSDSKILGIIGLISLFSFLFLLARYLFMNTITIVDKIKNILSVLVLNILFVIVLIALLFPALYFSESFNTFYRSYPLSGNIYLLDIIIIAVVIIIIIIIYHLIYRFVLRKYKNINKENLKRIFITALTLVLFFMMLVFLMFGFSKEFAGELF